MILNLVEDPVHSLLCVDMILTRGQMVESMLVDWIPGHSLLTGARVRMPLKGFLQLIPLIVGL